MPNSFVFRRPFTKRGQNWLPPTKPPLADVTGSGGVLVGGAATVLESVLVGTVTGAGGTVLGGAATVGYGDHVGAITGSGGVGAGGSAEVRFVHSGQVASDIVVEWDFDNDGDFSEQVENITPFVLSAETFTGRDWPSLLTGKAGPGKLRASLRNDDDRFSFFNSGSPLTTAPYSLRTGRKLRIRAAEANNPDPAPIARDRFRRAAGALGAEEYGLTYSEPLAADFTVSAHRAVATSEGSAHMALVDTGGADYYAQVKISVIGGGSPTNRVGIVYRYVDSDDYSLFQVNGQAGTVELVDVVAGTSIPQAGQSFELYDGITIGVLVEGASVTAYVEGVPLFTATSINTTAATAGFYADWVTGDDRPELDEFFVWDGLPSQVDGVLWTGDVADLIGSVEAGPRKAAMVSGEGWLSKLSTQQITPPVSVAGRKTGLLVGNVLAGAMLLHPPGPIDEGDVTTGAFAIDDATAMEVARRVEETEFGFLHETQEGYLAFASRSHRDGSTSKVTFTDAPDGKYGYHRLEPYDWRREVFNRVVAGVSPWTEGEEATLFTDAGPYVLGPGQSVMLQASYNGIVARWAGHTRDVHTGGAPVVASAHTDSEGLSSTFTVSMPATVNEGDLLLVVVATFSEQQWRAHIPAGWTYLGGKSDVMVKVATGSEGGTNVVIDPEISPTVTYWAANVYRITDWFGTLDGVEVSGTVYKGDSNPNAPAMSPSWGATDTLFIACYSGTVSGIGSRSQTAIPSGYSNGLFGASSETYVGSARRIASVATEDPGTFTLNGDVNWTAKTIAIRGSSIVTSVAAATPGGPDGSFLIEYDAVIGGSVQSHQNIQVSGAPLTQGDQTFAQVDDYDSQDEHNAIRTYQNSANLFANAADAEVYAQLVLDTYADDRPIVAMSFYASKSKAYRKQALTRRVGDRITLIADHTTGFGIKRDFFIESVSHRWSHGTRLWETTWELSPAD